MIVIQAKNFVHYTEVRLALLQKKTLKVFSYYYYVSRFKYGQPCWYDKYPDNARLPVMLWDTVGTASFDCSPEVAESCRLMSAFVQNIVHSPRWNL